MFVRGAPPIWFEFNQTGSIFNPTYYAFFLTNTLPYIPQTVWQDPDGIIPWSNPIKFQANGGLTDNIYFDPSLVYRIEFRTGPNQTFPLVGNPIENYTVAGSSGTVTVTDPLTVAENMITNPQFADIYFSSPATFTTAGTYNIAPGWQLVLAGSGTTVLTQVALPGSANDQGNPPYYLTINNSGWTSAQLIQQFNNNGAIFGSGAIAMSILALATSNPENLTVQYVANGTPVSPDIFNGLQVGASTFTSYYSAIDLPASVNSTSGTAANVQIVFSLPTTGILSLTDIQLTGQTQPLSDTFEYPDATATIPNDVPLFNQLTYERIVDHEFHVYRQSLLREQKNSILVGWNFANNPWQFYSITHGNVAANEYTADQTIMIQQNYVTSATGNNVNVTRDSETHNYGYAVTAVTAHNEFAILQYIDPQSARALWNNYVSSMVSCTLYSAHSSTVTLKMRLIYKAALPGTVSQTDPIATWTENGDPVAAAGYTLIVPPNDPIYTLAANVNNQFVFDKIQLPASTNDNMTLGILVYTTKNMNQASTADYITFNDISLVLNDFALPTQSETFDQTLSKCQYYYEKSNPVGQLAGVTSGSNYLTLYQNNFGTANLYFTTFMFYYKTVKRAVPLVSTWALDGTASSIKLVLLLDGSAATASGGSANSNPYNAANSNWTFTNFTDKSFATSKDTHTAQITSTSTTVEAIAQFQYALDARLGI